LLCGRIEMGRGNISTHVERAAPEGVSAQPERR
jgi:hypothetical protein